MTYVAYESSNENGSPVELYTFQRDAEIWRYNTTEFNYTYNSAVFAPFPIKRGTIGQSENVFKDGVDIEFPKDDSFAKLFFYTLIEVPTIVTIYRGHVNDVDQEFIVYWKGRVTGAKATDKKIILSCESVFTTIRQPGLRAKFEYTCRHALYQSGCNVNKELYKTEGPILAVTDANNFTIAEASLEADGYFNGGIAEFSDGSLRHIINHVGTTVTISRTATGLVASTTVKLYPGCDHTSATCTSKFGNLVNYGGFPYIPTRNPFTTSLT